VEIDGIIPAPYMARNHWVAMLQIDALRQPEIRELIQNSYQLVLEKLPKKTQAALGADPPTNKPKARVRKAKPRKAKSRKTKLPRAAKRRK
jgi:acyl transferase domain-containing protein